jgi:hypothetical protein
MVLGAMIAAHNGERRAFWQASPAVRHSQRIFRISLGKTTKLA